MLMTVGKYTKLIAIIITTQSKTPFAFDQDGMGCDSTRPVDTHRIDSSPARHEVDDVHSTTQGAMGSDSSGSGEREDTV